MLRSTKLLVAGDPENNNLVYFLLDFRLFICYLFVFVQFLSFQRTFMVYKIKLHIIIRKLNNISVLNIKPEQISLKGLS